MNSQVSIGERDQRVRVQARSVAKVNGEEREAFASRGTFWAKAVPMSAGERQGGGIDLTTEIYRFFFAWNATTKSIAASDRLVWAGKSWIVRQPPNAASRDLIMVIAEYSEPSGRG